MNVALLPLGHIQSKYIDAARRVINTCCHSAFLPVKITLLHHQHIQAITTCNSNGQYHGDRALEYLRCEYRNPHIDKVIAITDKDLRIISRVGVYGYASLKDGTAIISTYRMKDILQRFEKVMLHEFAHMFGLHHCEVSRCVLNNIGPHIKELDDLSPYLCNTCFGKIIDETFPLLK